MIYCTWNYLHASTLLKNTYLIWRSIVLRLRILICVLKINTQSWVVRNFGTTRKCFFHPHIIPRGINLFGGVLSNVMLILRLSHSKSRLEHVWLYCKLYTLWYKLIKVLLDPSLKNKERNPPKILKFARLPMPNWRYMYAKVAESKE